MTEMDKETLKEQLEKEKEYSLKLYLENENLKQALALLLNNPPELKIILEMLRKQDSEYYEKMYENR